MGSFIPLVFSTFGGMGYAVVFYKRLALISQKGSLYIVQSSHGRIAGLPNVQSPGINYRLQTYNHY